MQKKEAESKIKLLQFPSLSFSRKTAKERFPEQFGSVRQQKARGHQRTASIQHQHQHLLPRAGRSAARVPRDLQQTRAEQSSQKQTSRWLNEGLRSCSGTLSAHRPARSWNETPLVGRMNFKRVCWTYAHVFVLISQAAQMHRFSCRDKRIHYHVFRASQNLLCCVVWWDIQSNLGLFVIWVHNR